MTIRRSTTGKAADFHRAVHSNVLWVSEALYAMSTLYGGGALRNRTEDESAARASASLGELLDTADQTLSELTALSSRSLSAEKHSITADKFQKLQTIIRQLYQQLGQSGLTQDQRAVVSRACYILAGYADCNEQAESALTELHAVIAQFESDEDLKPVLSIRIHNARQNPERMILNEILRSRAHPLTDAAITLYAQISLVHQYSS